MELSWGIFDISDNPIVGGAASTSVKIRRESDGFLLDWDDLVFKNSGWTTLSTTLSEIDAENVAGYYKKDVSESGWSDDWYMVFVRYTGPPKCNGDLEFYIKSGKIIEVHLGNNLDAAISSIPSVIVPVMKGSVYSATTMQDEDVRVARGDTENIPFDLEKDCTGWDAWFGAKKKLSDTLYVINPLQCIWTDQAKGQGYIPLTDTETAITGSSFAEIEVRQGETTRHTDIRYKLIIFDDVIK